MTDRIYVKCEVCGTVVILRVLVGFLEEYPVRIICKECGITLHGKISIKHQEIAISYAFINAKQLDYEKDKRAVANAKYYLEISGELPTIKARDTVGGEIPELITPFIRAFSEMENGGLEKFQRITSFIGNYKVRWPKVRRVNELWLNGKEEYLRAELRPMLPSEAYSLENRLLTLHGVRHFNINFWAPLLPDPDFNQKCSLIHNNIKEKGKTIGERIDSIITNELVQRYNKSILDSFSEFIHVFQFLIPAFSLEYYKNPVSPEKGLSTCTIDDIKHYYLDTFEKITEMSGLIVGLNNLIARGDINAMAPLDPKHIKSLSDYNDLSKGRRLAYLNTADPLNFVFNGLNCKIRNAIGHNSYNLDPNAQLMTYKDGKHTPGNIYLIDFAHLCRKLFLSMLYFSEIVYWLEKILLIKSGNVPGRAPSSGLGRVNWGDRQNSILF